MTARIPEGMSSVDAFAALYENAKMIGMGRYAPSSGKSPKTPWNIIQMFHNYCHNSNCDYVRGKYMKVYFGNFPKLDVSNYDRQYGEGAAQKAMDTYQKTHKSDPKYDLDCDPCKYFTSEWKKITPKDQREDLSEMFSNCQNFRESEKRAQELINKTNSSRFLSFCKASYALVSPPVDYIPHNDKSCEEALDHLTRVLKNGQRNLYVEGLSSCTYNHSFSFLKKCQKLDGKVSIDTAIKILEAQNL